MGNGRRGRFGRDDSGNLMLVAGITLMLAFIVTSLTLGDVRNIDGRTLQDRDRSFLNEYRFIHGKIDSAFATSITEDTDPETFLDDFLDMVETVQALEASKGYQVVVRLANASTATEHVKNEWSFVDSFGYYTNWSHDGDIRYEDVPYDGTPDGFVHQHDRLVGVVVNLYLSDGVRGVSETVLYPLNDVERTPSTELGIASSPQGLSAVSNGIDTVIDWYPPAIASSAVRHYEVYLTSPGGTRTWYANTTNGNDRSITFPGLTLGETYTFEVVPVTASLRGPSPATLTFLVTPTVPSAPRDFAIARTDGSLDLTWIEPLSGGYGGVTGYRVYRGDATTRTLVADLGPTVRSWSDTNLTDGETRHYNVTAVNVIGEATTSAIAATFAHVPDAPQDFALAATASNITVTWTAPADANGDPVTGYDVYRGTVPGSLTLLASTTSLSYVDAAVSPATTYYYQVRAVNGIGAGAPTPEESAVLGSAPTAPLNVAATAGNGSVTVTWDDPTETGGGLTGFYVSHRLNGTLPWTTVAVGPAIHSRNVTGLVNGSAYDFRVAAYNAAGDANSSHVTATPAGAPYPPTAVVATGGVGNIAVTWVAPASDGGSAITSYTIERRTSSGAWSVVRTGETGVLYTDSSAAALTTYSYRVSALNAKGQSAWSSESAPAMSVT